MQQTLTECPFCGKALPANAEACPNCDLPLLDPSTQLSDDEFPPPLPEYCKGNPRVVVSAANQVEAEMIQGLLRGRGIPCLVRRSASADVPDFLAAGWRDVLVPESGHAAACDLLGIEPQQGAQNTTTVREFFFRFVVAALACVIIAAVIYMLAG
jgi:hypothetical protein